MSWDHTRSGLWSLPLAGARQQTGAARSAAIAWTGAELMRCAVRTARSAVDKLK